MHRVFHGYGHRNTGFNENMFFILPHTVPGNQGHEIHGGLSHRSEESEGLGLDITKILDH